MSITQKKRNQIKNSVLLGNQASKMSDELATQVFPVTEEDVASVRAIYEKSERDVVDDVEELMEWMKGQPHLPKSADKARLERFLLRNKFRLKRTKAKLESYYTMRGQHMDVFKCLDPNSEEMRNVRKCMIYTPTPVLTPKLERVIVSQFDPELSKLFNLEHGFVYTMAILDLALSYDYSVGDRIVCDMSGCTFNHVKAVRLMTLIKCVRLHQTAFSGRITGIDYINPPSYMKVVLMILKLGLPASLYKKIQIHDSLESLHEIVPKNCLPPEFGGELEQSIQELHETTGKLLFEKRQFLLQNATQVSDEKLRVKS